MSLCRVLYLIDRLDRGGAAQVVVNAAMSLDRHRFAPIVCVTRDYPMMGYDDVLRECGVPLICLKRTSSWNVFAWKRLWQILPTITILHAHESGSNFWGRIWGKCFRLPVLVTQEHTAANEKSHLVRFFDKALRSFSDKIIAVSEYDRKLLLQCENLPSDQVITIYNGIDINKFDCHLNKHDARKKANLPHEKFIVAVVARLYPQKNHKGFFATLTIMPASIKAAMKCVIIGGGELEPELREEVESLGLQDMVSFLGERSDVPILLRAIDLLVLPSNWECLPMIILEALAAKCPVVATAVGGIPEILNGVGWPTPPPKDPGALAKAIQVVFEMNSEHRNALTERGREVVVKTFNKAVSVRALEQLYYSLLVAEDNKRKDWKPKT